MPPRFRTRRQTGSVRLLRPSRGCGRILGEVIVSDCEDRAPIRVVMDLPSMSEPRTRRLDAWPSEA